MTTTSLLTTKKLRLSDLARVAGVGLRTRKLRAGLSALGIAIGVAAIVAVLGLSSSSQAGLLSEIDKLGTNLLVVTNGQNLFGKTAELPKAAPGMLVRIGPVTQVQDTGSVTANAYRSPLVPSIDTNALSVDAASLGLPRAVGTTVAQGSYLNAATAKVPVAVLGATAAKRLGIDRVFPRERIWLGGQWFYVAGILHPAVLAPEIDSSVLVGFPAGETYLGFDGHPSTIYIRAQTDQVSAVHSVLAATANPEAPNQVNVSQPSAALVARADAQSALNGLFLGLGPSLCSSVPSGWPTSWSSLSSNAAVRSGCDAPLEPPKAISASSSCPRPSSWPCSVVLWGLPVVFSPLRFTPRPRAGQSWSPLLLGAAASVQRSLSGLWRDFFPRFAPLACLPPRHCGPSRCPTRV
jgi:putative ABC transport system permease protein